MAKRKEKRERRSMVLEPDAAGIDIGAEEIYVAVPPDRDEESTRRFSSFTGDLHALADWLSRCRIRSVAMESTGVYWIPLFQILEERGFKVYLACEPRLGRVFLSGLPPVFKVSIRNHASGRWLENSIRFFVDQADRLQPGGEAVLAKLSEVLFVETLRGYIAQLPANQTGWLASARDPGIGRVLALMHRDPAHPWTIASLAEEAGMSRSVLAERFRYYLDETPMAYLTFWRLQLGAQMLSSTNYSVAQIAAEVGYESEAAFNRAFKRAFGLPPARLRQSGNQTPPTHGKPTQDLGSRSWLYTRASSRLMSTPLKRGVPWEQGPPPLHQPEGSVR
jgi:AraC-like DNA-binding protein